MITYQFLQLSQISWIEEVHIVPEKIKKILFITNMIQLKNNVSILKSTYKWTWLAFITWIWVFVVITCKYSSIPCFYNCFSLFTNGFSISVNLTLLYFSIQRWTKDTISISFLPFVHYLFNFWIENLKSYCFVDIFRRVCRMLTEKWDSLTHIKDMFIYLYDHQSLFASSVDEGIFKIGRRFQHRLEGPSIANVASGRYLQAKTHTIPQVLFWF